MLQQEGVSSMFKGTNVGLMLAVPLVAIYLPLYDVFSAYLAPSNIGLFGPLAAGTPTYSQFHLLKHRTALLQWKRHSTFTFLP